VEEAEENQSYSTIFGDIVGLVLYLVCHLLLFNGTRVSNAWM
jgi:hypothetical protein